MSKRIIIKSVAVLLLSLLSVSIQAQDSINEEEIKIASAYRLIIDKSLTGNTLSYDAVKNMLLNGIEKYFLKSDSALYLRLLIKLNKDSSAVKECKYIYEIKSQWKSVKSKYFIFYYSGDKQFDKAQTEFWDNQYERLLKFFKTQMTNPVDFIIDPKENFGRCFPPWEIFTGIRQSSVDLNPHELVHLMLFKYNDTPFFHEPLAFIYGTDLGDSLKTRERFIRYGKKLNPDKFVSSPDLIHFPQIIGLDEFKWASAFCFVYKLNEKYGTGKLLTLLKENLWNDAGKNFKNSFRRIYGLDLNTFENELKKEISGM